MTDLDFTATDFNAMTVGELYALTHNPDFRPQAYSEDNHAHRSNIPTADLMKLAQVGRSLLCEAVALADEPDNAEFFEHAFGYCGLLVTAALEEMCLPDRSTHDGTEVSR